MFYKKRVEELEKQVRYLEDILGATSVILKRYINEHKVCEFDFFTTGSPIENIYCVLTNLDKRLKKLEENKDKKEK